MQDRPVAGPLLGGAVRRADWRMAWAVDVSSITQDAGSEGFAGLARAETVSFAIGHWVPIVAALAPPHTSQSCPPTA
ncbi:hypothetical protein IG631_06482 [Alternaria alternata]|nr:hypothetical protein IG631_06482 [Alternaria alternata]